MNELLDSVVGQLEDLAASIDYGDITRNHLSEQIESIIKEIQEYAK